MSRTNWIWTEAEKIANKTSKKNIITFATGYGASGLIHCGSLSETIRTTFVRRAVEHITNKKTKMIVFSDDMDALRKVPTNVPNQEMLQDYIGVPLTSIPDPFGCCESFAHHNNNMMKGLLNQYEIEHDFMSSTDCYKSGMFNETLTLIARHLSEIKNIVTREYRQERKDSYCPFLPIHNGITYHDVYDWSIYPDGLPEPFLYWFKNTRSPESEYDDRQDVVTHILNGNVKAQWKVDWALRWIALGVDYEMHGKDLIDSASIGQKICKLLNKPAPINFMYELFLDENGEKISKSRGNGLNISDWWHYGTKEVLSYYMFQNPRKARKLHFDIIPQAADDYIKSMDLFNREQDEDNVVWHIHDGIVPYYSSPISFSMLLNLVSITNTDDPELIWKYILNYRNDLNRNDYPFLNSLVLRAINYYNDRVLPYKNYRIPNDFEKNVLQNLIDHLRIVEKTEQAITECCYNVGKIYYKPEDLKNYFQMIYEVIMGQSSGPRFPIFVVLYGVDNTIRTIEDKIRN